MRGAVDDGEGGPRDAGPPLVGVLWRDRGVLGAPHEIHGEGAAGADGLRLLLQPAPRHLGQVAVEVPQEPGLAGYLPGECVHEVAEELGVGLAEVWDVVAELLGSELAQHRSPPDERKGSVANAPDPQERHVGRKDGPRRLQRCRCEQYEPADHLRAHRSVLCGDHTPHGSAHEDEPRLPQRSPTTKPDAKKQLFKLLGIQVRRVRDWLRGLRVDGHVAQSPTVAIVRKQGFAAILRCQSVLQFGPGDAPERKPVDQHDNWAIV
mmetsp:Transcript_37818/g.89800  ORF Transcript_37818/g.89800 Transcript_37818/m.89800 type:complete len:264 (-) Transcript_37818:437-1228(-)